MVAAAVEPRTAGAILVHTYIYTADTAAVEPRTASAILVLL